jgi:hypothetical protein
VKIGDRKMFKKFFLGYFDSEKEAFKAYRVKKIELVKEKLRRNEWIN